MVVLYVVGLLAAGTLLNTGAQLLSPVAWLGCVVGLCVAGLWDLRLLSGWED